MEKINIIKAGLCPDQFTHTGRDSAEDKRIRICRISEGQKQPVDSRAARESEVQVQRVLCRRNRKKHKKNCGIHPKSTERRTGSRPDNDEEICRPVYG